MSGHSLVSLGARHPVHNWEYANAAARTGASGFVASDVGKVAKQNDDNTFWVLNTTAPVWTQLDSGGAVPTGRTLTAGAGLTGGGDLSADRTFNVVANGDGSMVVNADDIQVGVLATDGQHGVRGGGTQHANAVPAGAAGFMTGADKTKLDGVATGAAALTATAPVDVTKAAAVVGVGTTAARHDHKHDITTAAPSSIGTANSEGAATSLARSNHVHNHGNQTTATHHAVATTGANGFMSSADKTKLDAVLNTVASPASITADQNNYDPGATTGIARLTTSARWRITGFAGGTAGRTLYLMNIGSNALVLGNENASSTAANRITIAGARDAVVAPDEVVFLIYDAVTSRWRLQERLRFIGTRDYQFALMDLPVNADYPITAMAPTDRGTTNTGLLVATFDDTVEQGRVVPGVLCPGILTHGVNAARVLFTYVSRPAVAPPAARTVGVKIYYRQATDNGAWGSWSSIVLADIDITANTNVQYDYYLLDFGAGGGQINLVAGRDTQFLFSRIAPTGGTNLVNDWLPKALHIGWLP